MAKHETTFLVFSLDKNHVYRMHSTDWGFAYSTNGEVTFYAIEDPHRKATYQVGTLNRLNAEGSIEVRPYALLPEHLRPVQCGSADDAFIRQLPPAPGKRVRMKQAMVLSYLDLVALKAFKVNDAEIDAQMHVIRDGAELYLAEELPNPEYDEQLKAWEKGEGPKPRSKSTVELPGKVAGGTLRKWASKYKKGGLPALVDRIQERGNHFSYFTLDEMSLLAKVVNKEYLTRQRKQLSTVLADVKAAFKKENKNREETGEAQLRVPGRDALRKFVKSLNKFHVLVARHGHDEAMKKMRPTFKGLEVGRPFERVEMDEWRIDLLTILSQSGLLKMFSPEEREKMGLTGELKRWWMVGAIDCRTNCIVGLSLAPNPKTSSAIKCLRMVVSDKGQFADEIGTLTPWSMFGTPETLYVDNGSAFKSNLFRSVCTDLGITKVQTIAGQASMRGKIERSFRTLGSTLLPRLDGRTFGSVVERGTHPAEERACHTIEDLIYALVRWVVDVYHNTPQEALNMRTPLEQWEADLEEGNYPLMAAPTKRRKRIAFGLPLERVLQKDGIRVLNVRYQSHDLAAWFLANGKRKIDVRWFEEDIGMIEVGLDGEWHEVSAVFDHFNGVNASTWVAARRALRSRDAKRLEWEEDVIAQTIADVEALNSVRKAECKIIDHGWNKERFRAVEREAMASFDITPTRDKQVQTADGYGRSVLPVAEPKPVAARDTATQDPEEKSMASDAAAETWIVHD